MQEELSIYVNLRVYVSKCFNDISLLDMTVQSKVRNFMNKFCLTTFSSSYFEAWMALPFWFFLVEGYLFHLIFNLTKKWNILNFVSQFRGTFRILSKIQVEVFPKLVNGFSFLTIFMLDKGKVPSLPLKPVAICGKSTISDVWQGFAFSFIAINCFLKLLDICLLNLINIFQHISSNTRLCTLLIILQ